MSNLRLVQTPSGRWVVADLDREESLYSKLLHQLGHPEEVDEDEEEEIEEEYYPAYEESFEGDIPDEDDYLYNQYLAEQLRKRQNAARIIQTAATAGGALVGTGLGGPLGGAAGGAAGSLIGQAISPTPGKEWSFGRAVPPALIAGLAGGISPLILPGIAPIASGIGGGIAGYFNARRRTR